MGPEILALLIPIVALLTGGAIVCTAILVKHQRSMAELLHRNQEDNSLTADLIAMRQELAQLRDRLNQQQIELDEYRSAEQASEGLEQRLQ